MRPETTVVGVGADAVDVATMRRVLADAGPAFVRRVLTAREAEHLARSRDPAVTLARLFAAKEAAFKALRESAQRRREFVAIEVVDPGARHSALRVADDDTATTPCELAVTFRRDGPLVTAYAIAVRVRPPATPSPRRGTQATRVRWVGPAHSRHRITDGGNSRSG